MRAGLQEPVKDVVDVFRYMKNAAGTEGGDGTAALLTLAAILYSALDDIEGSVDRLAYNFDPLVLDKGDDK